MGFFAASGLPLTTSGRGPCGGRRRGASGTCDLVRMPFGQGLSWMLWRSFAPTQSQMSAREGSLSPVASSAARASNFTSLGICGVGLT